MKNGPGSQNILIGISVLYILLLYILFIFTFPVYFYSDNWEVAVVTAGYFGSNICQYIHPLLCLVIRVIGIVLPMADVFTLLVHIAIFLCMVLTSYLALERFCRKDIRNNSISDWFFIINIALTELFISECLKIWNANYNIQTGAILFYGIVLLYLTMRQRRTISWLIASTGLIVFGLMLRVAVAYLYIPYVLLILLTEILDSRSCNLSDSRSGILSGFKHYLLPGLLISIVLVCSRTMILSIEPYKSAEAYNKYRTVAVDYPMKPWEEIEDPKFSKSTYAAATDWVFIDTESLDAESFKEIVESGSKNQYAVSDVYSILRDMWRRVGKIDVYMLLMFLGTMLLAIMNLTCAQSKWRRLETILAVFGSFVILYYFTFRGRAPLRVWQPVLFATDVVLIVAALQESSRKRLKSIFFLGLFIILWVGAGQVIAHNEIRSPQNILTARINADDSIYEETLQDDSVYIWANWHATIPKYFIEIGKLPTQRVIDHNIAAGDWTYGQVYYKEYLERIGVPNPAEALIERDNVYLMSGNEMLILDYLQEQYEMNLDLLEVGEINGKIAFKIVKADDSE